MQKLIDFLKKGTCAATVVKTIAEELDQAGFEELALSENWQLERGHSYYVKIRDTSCVAFRVAQEEGNPYFRIVSGHTDQPCYKLKPQPELKDGASNKLNVSVYGGPIHNTWLDRPLSLAGRVVLKGENPFDTKACVVDLKKPLLVIPNLAIHMNREVNKGKELNPQVDLQPLAGLNMDGAFITKALSQELNVAEDAILDYELYTYNADEPTVVGFNGELLSAPRLDDLVMVGAAVEAMIENMPKTGITVLAALDNEEIGSRTAQGGGSAMVSLLLEKIAACFGKDRSEYIDALTGSFMLSADVAHAVHPNHGEVHDKVNRPVMGGGPVIKLDAGQRYMTNAADYTVYRQICEAEGVPVQTFISRADMVSGSTLGPVMCGFLPCRIVDIGTPMLSMHSAREMMACIDYEYTKRSFAGIYKL
ncbi:MAG: M18 family aminopeptidase [Firmicutes bacterium]|nr:M18 family aminopeptidase [Bacillota bacterium]